MIKTSEYNLPDMLLLEKSTNSFSIWVPDKTYVVLGASNHPEEALNTEIVKQDNIAVLKRPSGGQTVVLTPNNLIISAAFLDDENANPKDVFLQINKLIISGLENMGVKHLQQKGISDIAIQDKKILGSSIYRRKNALLYHAVLNLGEPAETFEKYLKHPTKEPEYRNGRSHAEFVTSLREKGYLQSYSHFKDVIVMSFEESFNK